MKPNIEELSKEYAKQTYGISPEQFTVVKDFIAGAKAMEEYYKSQQQEIWDASRMIITGKDYTTGAFGASMQYSTLEDYLKTKEENPCKSFPINKGAIVDIPFEGKHVRFENLNAEQAAVLMHLCDQLSNFPRKGVQTLKTKE